ncbi:AGAP002790-PA-like protein [Anopheles sinensis]|uniref:AGAP002790-PA-like protein n=1 Tax=Anopheles sinensis TaxID=74873 RepID=A0A084VGB1_ANOSI|nr:AGAP002790-PA-like protein [Anopheles sinensis]
MPNESRIEISILDGSAKSSPFTLLRVAASPRWEPQISVLCEAGQTYHPQYLSEEGRWTTDLSVKVPGSTCLRDKMDLLDYCKKSNAFEMWSPAAVGTGIGSVTTVV